MVNESRPLDKIKVWTEIVIALTALLLLIRQSLEMLGLQFDNFGKLALILGVVFLAILSFRNTKSKHL
jgi:hypothetical protein